MALVEGCKHALDITVPVTEVDQETERAAVAIQGKARLPGFRPGKAPLSIVKTRFAGDIRQEVLDALVPRYLQAAVEKENLQLVGRPGISDVHFHAGEPLRFKAEFEVAPTFDLGEYRGVTITYNEPEVADADVDARVEQIRDQKAQYVNEEPRALVDGDYAVVSLESLEGVEEKVSQDELMLKIGDEATMKEFSENLRGASPEDTREFSVTYPEDYDRPALAGKTVKFQAVVKAVRRKELPELNDEFAKKVNDQWDLAQLREEVRKAITHRREQSREESKTSQVISHLAEKLEFELPQDVVNREAQRRTNDIAMNAMRQGMAQEAIMEAQDQIVSAATQQARQNVKVSFILGEVAKKEKIIVEQDQVRRALSNLAARQKNPKKFLAEAQKNGMIGRLQEDLLLENALAFLKENAQVEETDPVKDDCGHDHSHDHDHDHGEGHEH